MLPASAEPVCFMVDGAGKMVDLTGMCGATKNKLAATVLTSTSASAGRNTKRLVYFGSSVRTYIDLETYVQYDRKREAIFERITPSIVETTKVRTVCDGDTGQIDTSNTTTYQRSSTNQTSTTGGTDLGLTEKATIARFLCSNTEASIKSLTPTESIGACDYPWQKDSAGKMCGDRAASRRPGGK